MNSYEPTGFSHELISRLRGEIARFDVNQAQLAAICGVSQSQFSKIIRGVRPATIDQVAVICDALDIDLASLAGDVDAFVNECDIFPSPVIYVAGKRKLPTPQNRPLESLDGWGKQAAENLRNATLSNVSGSMDTADSSRQSDHDLAAKKRSKNRGEVDFD